MQDKLCLPQPMTLEVWRNAPFLATADALQWKAAPSYAEKFNKTIQPRQYTQRSTISAVQGAAFRARQKSHNAAEPRKPQSLLPMSLMTSRLLVVGADAWSTC
jgi:hypothetical protein